MMAKHKKRRKKIDFMRDRVYVDWMALLITLITIPLLLLIVWTFINLSYSAAVW